MDAYCTELSKIQKRLKSSRKKLRDVTDLRDKLAKMSDSERKKPSALTVEQRDKLERLDTLTEEITLLEEEEGNWRSWQV